jgi:hypothetical protein
MPFLSINVSGFLFDRVSVSFLVFFLVAFN